MSNVYADTSDTEAVTLHCPQCGRAMRVHGEHVRTPVSCPHCRQTLDPSRVMGAMHEQAQGVPPPPPAYYAQDQQWVGYSWRNRWVAGALGVLLPGFGVHRFYLGHTGLGVAQIVVSVLTVFTIGPIWGFIDGILCFCGAIRDADGLPLRG